MTTNVHQHEVSKLSIGASLNHDTQRSMKAKYAPLSVSERIKRQLDRLMASPLIYKISVSNVFTRWFALRRTQQVFDLMAGFVNFQVLLICVRCGLLERVYSSPCEYDDLFKYIKLPKENLDLLIKSAISLGLLERRGKHRFGIGKLGLPVVCHPGICSMVEHNAVLYNDMQDTWKLLASTEKSRMNEFWPYAKPVEQGGAKSQAESTLGEERTKQFAKYSELMSASQNFVIDEILGAYDFSGHSKMLDIGCGKGRFVSAVAEHYPELEFALMDLPEVIHLTKQNLIEKSFYKRIQLFPGSFKLDPLPQGVDLITLVRVAHDHSDLVVKTLLKKIYQSLPSKGTLLLAEPMANPEGARHDAYFHFYLLAMGEGRLRTPDQLTDMILEAGFSGVEVLSNPMAIHAKVLIARKY